MSQDLGYLSFRLPVIPAVVRDLTDNLMPRHSSLGTLRRHKDILTDLRVVRYDKSIVLIALVIDTDDLLHASCQDLYDLCLLASAVLPRTVPWQQRYPDCILMKSPVHKILRNVQILIPSFDLHEPETFWMAGKSPDQLLIWMFRLDKFSLLGERELSLRQQLVQEAVQLSPVLLRDLQHDCKLLLFHRYIKLRWYQIHDHFLSLIWHFTPFFYGGCISFKHTQSQCSLAPDYEKTLLYKRVFRGFILNIFKNLYSKQSQAA